MKKIILFLGVVFMLSGCGKYNDNDLLKELNSKIEDSKNYQITATLDIYRNEEKFSYDVVSTYKKGDYFKVELVNKKNNHEQIILKDQESVYVLTPALNKSFKFQSEWPYNNSQIYLLQPILKDIEVDSERKFETFDNGYTITSKVNYSSEKDFKYQKVYFDLDKNITKVEILDDNENVKMMLNVINIKYNEKLDNDLFDVNRYQKKIEEDKTSDECTNNDCTINKEAINELGEIVYPMYVPTDTYLTSQDVVSTDSGERVILTFSGESNFTLVQENIKESDSINYVYGDPYLILDTVGSITDYSVSWISNGVEYSVMSDTMSVDELMTVAQSITVQTVGK